MAEELLGWDIGILKARGDLSSSQHRFVQISGAKFVGISSAGTEPDGILQNKPESGRACQVRRIGLSKLDLVGTVVAGDKLKPSTDGKGIATDTDEDKYGAKALENGITGQTITVLLAFGEH